MTTTNHLRLTIHGAYTSAEASEEVWAMNIRQALVFGAADDLGAFPSWDVVPDFAEHTETDWVTEQTFHINGPGSSTFDPSSYLTDYVGPSIQALADNAGHASRVAFLGANLYPCDNTGKSVDGNYARLTFSGNVNGNRTTNMLPLENSVVASWETHRLGARGRGRVFGPAITVGAVASDGTLDGTFQGAYADAYQALIEGLAYTSAGPIGIHLRSVVTGPSSTHGQPPYSQYATIIGMRVGNVIDTQRRRRNKQREVYTARTVTQT